MKAISALLPYLAPMCLIIGCLALKGAGINNTVDTILLGAAAFVFGYTLSSSEYRTK